MRIPKKLLSISAVLALLASVFTAAPSQALEQRVIDVVSVTWNRAGALPGTVTQLKGEIDTVVNPLWKQLTTISGDPIDKRIEFVGGLRGLGELEKRVNSGEMKVAFALFPVTMKQLIDISDSGKIMPPKTTWFEPKLRSGLVLHALDEPYTLD